MQQESQMDTTNSLSPNTSDVAGGTKDGTTAADNDLPYRFGRRPNVQAPYPFNERQFARLLILRSRVQARIFADQQVAA
jgi:uncharacterized Fe-S cluster-containing radical SAM superfamily enzyme